MRSDRHRARDSRRAQADTPGRCGRRARGLAAATAGEVESWRLVDVAKVVGVVRVVRVVRVVSLVSVIGLAGLLGLAGCAADRVVATRQDPGSARCGEPVALGSASEPLIGDLLAYEGGALLLWSDDESSLAMRLDADGAPMEVSSLGARLALVRPRALVEAGGALHVSAQNHFVQGAWRVYYDRADLFEQGWSWDRALRLSEEGPEALDTAIAQIGPRVAVAYRQGNGVQLAILEDGAPTIRTALPDTRALPFVRSLVAAGDGVALLAEVNGTARLERFDAGGGHLGEQARWSAGAGALVEGPRVVLGTADGVALATASSEPVLVAASGPVEGVDAARGGGAVWIAARGADGGAELLGAADGGAVSRDALGDAVDDARVAWLGDRALAVWVDASGDTPTLWAAPFCRE